MENHDEMTEIEMTPIEFMDLFYDSWLRMLDKYCFSEDELEKSFFTSTSMIATLAYFIDKILINNVEEKDRENFINALIKSINNRMELYNKTDKEKEEIILKSKKMYLDVLNEIKNEASESHNQSAAEKPQEVQE